MSLINWPILYIPDPDKGRPLFSGQVFVGKPDLDPVIPANQKQLSVIEEDGNTVDVDQPFLLSAGGVPVYNGNPVRLSVAGNYSIKILSKLGAQVYYIENVFEKENTDEIIPLSSGQTTVSLSVLDANTAVFYIQGKNVDIGLMSEGIDNDYTVTDDLTIELTSSFPDGSFISGFGSIIVPTTDVSAVSFIATTTLLINTALTVVAGDVSETTGFTDKGDGGGAQWIATGNTGATSKSPSDLGTLNLTNASGNEYELVRENTVSIKTVGNSVSACESVAGLRIDMGGQDITSTLASVSNNYFNGTLTLTGATSDITEQKQLLKESDYSIARPRTKSPELDWAGKNVLWLGTSLPAQGGVDSYPIRFGSILNCNVENFSFAGSHAEYDFNGDAFDINTIKALSMTEADRLFGLATFGSSSAYDDSFDPITKASQMTADFRIKAQFEIAPQDVVFLDHNHNDRKGDKGILNPTKISIVSVTIGTTTDVELSSVVGLVIGNGAALEIVGIPNLNYAAGRISAIVSNTVTIEYDSTGFTGTFTSGDFVELDRITVYGAWNFLIYFIKNMSVIHNENEVKIVLCGAPSEYTAGSSYDQFIWRVGELIKDVADKWELSFFDIGFLYDIKFHDHDTYFPDLTHPSTPEARAVLTNYWVEWAVGGANKQPNADDFLPAGDKPFLPDREAIYDEANQGFETPVNIYTVGTELINDDFSAGLGAWTLFGVIPPVVVSDPWGGGGDAVFCEGTSSDASLLDNLQSFGDNIKFEFDFYMPIVEGLIGQGDVLGTITICQCRVPQGYFQLQMIARSSGVSMRVVYFKSPNTDLVNLPGVNFNFLAATRYNIRITLQKSTSATSPNGKLIIYIDDVFAFSQGDLDTFGQTAVNTFRLGSSMSNVDAFDCYFGNVLLNQLTANDFTQRFTGAFTAQTGEVVTVVNGIIVTAI